MSFEEFQDGRRGGQRWPSSISVQNGHLGYRNGMILAILKPCVTVMPHIKFQLNQTWCLEGDVVRRISRWPP